MPRPNYVNYAVPPGGHREKLLRAVCNSLGLEHEHRDYLVAIDTALAVLVAGVTNHPRRLCYRHHCEEFNKLPSIQRGEASGWMTVDRQWCELCQQE